MKELTAVVAPGEEGRLDRFLRLRFALPAGRVRSLKFTPGAVLVNGDPARADRLLSVGDRVTVRLPEKASAFEEVSLPLRILYEDEDILILDKPAGIAVHGRSERGDATLGNALAAYLGPETAFHPVNRLDRETSGAMVIAKNAYAHDRLRRLLHTPDFIREYRAVAEGETPDEGTIELPIRRESPDSYRRVCGDGGQMASTRFKTLIKGPERSYVSILPTTGRTHQIRSHFAAIGHPLTGDRLYGTPSPLIGRTALHSYRIAVTLPWNGKRVEAVAEVGEEITAAFGSDNGRRSRQ